MFTRHAALGLFTLVVLGAPAAPLAAQDNPDSWRSQLEFGFNGSSGNSSFGILRAGGKATHLQTDRFEFEINGLVRYGKSDDRVIADDLRGTLKFDWTPDADFSPFAFVTGSRDRIRNIDRRFNGGAGAKWTFLRHNEAKTKGSFSLAGTIDHEDFHLEPGSTEDETRTVLRWSARVKFDHDFGSGASFQHVTFWQPEVDSFSDYLIEMSNSLSTKIIQNLTLAIEHEYLHDEVPPPGTLADDQKFSVVIRIAL